MKTINRIQYFLFAIMLIGMFASFAQNDYSSYLLNYPNLFIGLLFFIQILISLPELRNRQASDLFIFFERLGLGLFFCGIFFMSMHWMGASMLYLTGVLIILILYSGLGIRKLSQYFNERKKSKLFLVNMAFITCLAIIAYIFKLQHWTTGSFMIIVSGIVSFILLLLIIFNVKMRQENEIISLRGYLYTIKSRLVLSYVFFSFWTVYFTMVTIGAAPKLYSFSNPPALEKMYQEQNPAAEIYRKNYQQFLDNRRANENFHQEKVSSKK